VSTLEPGGQPIEVDAPSAWTLADWQAYAARYHGPGCAVTPIAGLPTVWCRSTSMRPRAACEGVAGITPAQFRALLSHEDMADIEAGAIHHKTLKAYAQIGVRDVGERVDPRPLGRRAEPGTRGTGARGVRTLRTRCDSAFRGRHRYVQVVDTGDPGNAANGLPQRCFARLANGRV
jgi:hypothetical protein